MPRWPGFNLFSRSLSARVLWLTVSVILLVELAILMPSLGRERQLWLWERITQAHLAAFSLEVMPHGRQGAADPAVKLALLKLSGTEALELSQPGRTDLMLITQAVRPDRLVDLGAEPLVISMGRAVLAVLGLAGKRIEVVAPSPLQGDITVRIVVSGAALAQHLRLYTEHIAALSVIIALVTGLLVFAALDRLLVRPMRVITASIAGFRQDPEHAGQAELAALSRRRHDEIARAAAELAVMQDELRAALWRNARLAALGTAVAKISHDLRNILSSALLVADRLEATEDPQVRRAAATLIPAVERAAELVTRTLDFAREGPPAMVLAPASLRLLVAEVALVVAPEGHPVIENQVPGDLAPAIDRAQFFRVLVNLLRNAAEAGATRISLSLTRRDGVAELAICDDGPGLPAVVRENLFQPFISSGRRGGTGLGLAIARDLIRAHGGELRLRRSGPGGTEFVLEQPLEPAGYEPTAV